MDIFPAKQVGPYLLTATTSTLDVTTNFCRFTINHTTEPIDQIYVHEFNGRGWTEIYRTKTLLKSAQFVGVLKDVHRYLQANKIYETQEKHNLIEYQGMM